MLYSLKNEQAPKQKKSAVQHTTAGYAKWPFKDSPLRIPTKRCMNSDNKVMI